MSAPAASPVAYSVPFDKDSNNFQAESVQTGIEEASLVRRKITGTLRVPDGYLHITKNPVIALGGYLVIELGGEVFNL